MADEDGPADGPDTRDVADAVDGGNGDDRDADDGDDHALDLDDLQYPEFVFEGGDIGARGGFDLSRDCSREELQSLLRDLAGGLSSHDVAVESPDGHVRLGVAPQGVSMRFDPDEEFTGEFEVTVRLRAKAMFVNDDPSKTKVGARGGRGFVPVEMLTSDRDPSEFRCYNWIDDPTDP